MVGSGGLENHALKGIRGQPGEESAMALSIVGEVAHRSVGVETDIEPTFGNVDAGGLW